MSLQDPLSSQHQLLQPSPSPKARLQEADLLRRLQQARAEPVLVAVRQFLQVRLGQAQGKLVKASLNDVLLLQGEARTYEKLLNDLSGERTPIE